MAQIDTSDKGGKKKKGAQKKMHIHVDFTPMVDMNMLLITFFMLCTTMIQSRTTQIILPSNAETKEEDKQQAKADDAVTLLLDTEFEDNGVTPKHDKDGNTMHRIYYYDGMAVNNGELNSMKLAYYTSADPKSGVRQVLRERHKDAMEKYDALKADYLAKKITKEQFDEKAKEIASDKSLKHPVVIIKPLPNATYENLVSAIDELTVNQVTKYSIQKPDENDQKLLEKFQQENPGVKDVIAKPVRK